MNGDLSEDAFKSAVKKSRSHAGGKMKAQNRSMQAAELSYGQIMEMINAELREEFGDPFGTIHCWYAQEIYPDRVIIRDYDEGKFYEVPYTMVDGECEFGDAVEVQQTYTPKAASEGNNILDLAAKTHGFQLFNELGSFAEPPERMPLMPKPSTHKHASYGDVVITAERNERFAQNINDHVYQERIPVDLEHQLKLSGAAGYITSAEVNDDGSVDGIVEWTDLGRTAIENDRYCYVSPEWYDSWTHPMSEETYSDVVIGAALTTRPFFKESSLRPLIANESGLQFGDVPKVTEKTIVLNFTALAPTGDTVMTDAEKKAAEDAAAKKAAEELAAKQATENDPAKQFAEMQNQVKQLTERADRAEAETKKANERAAQLEKDARTSRFTEMAKKFTGEPATHVAMLEHLAMSEGGETSALFTGYVTQQEAVANQLREGNLFKEFGSSATGEGVGTAEARIEAATQKLMTEEPVNFGSHVKAYSEVLKRQPALYEEYRKELN